MHLDFPTKQIHFAELHRGSELVFDPAHPDQPVHWTVTQARGRIGEYTLVDYVTDDGWEGIHAEPGLLPVTVVWETHFGPEVAA